MRISAEIWARVGIGVGCIDALGCGEGRGDGVGRGVVGKGEGRGVGAGVGAPEGLRVAVITLRAVPLTEARADSSSSDTYTEGKTGRERGKKQGSRTGIKQAPLWPTMQLKDKQV